MFICCAYITPINSSINTWRDIDTPQIVEIETMKYSSFGDILICGDLNARTGNLGDFIPNDELTNLHNFSCQQVGMISVHNDDELSGDSD